MVNKMSVKFRKVKECERREANRTAFCSAMNRLTSHKEYSIPHKHIVMQIDCLSFEFSFAT